MGCVGFGSFVPRLGSKRLSTWEAAQPPASTKEQLRMAEDSAEHLGTRGSPQPEHSSFPGAYVILHVYKSKAQQASERLYQE